MFKPPDNKHLKKILTRRPKIWEKDKFGLESLAVFDRGKSSGLPSKLVRWSLFRRMDQMMNISFAHWNRLAYIRNVVGRKMDKNSDRVRVLDVGCGESDVRHFFYKNYITHTDYVGVELSNNALEYALGVKSCFPYMYLQLDVNNGIPLKHDWFDFIVCTEFIEHIGYDVGLKTMKQLRKLIKPDGVVFLSTPDKILSEGVYAKDHVHEYTYTGIKELIYDSGFIIKEEFGCSIKTKHLVRIATREQLDLYKKMKKYVSSTVLNQVFSPILSAASYDRLYILSKIEGVKIRVRK